MKKIFLSWVISFFVGSLFCQNFDYPFQNFNLTTEERVNDLMERLTLEEKILLLFHESPEIDRLGIDAYNWWNEALHGVARWGTATVFPQPIALAATFDKREIEYSFSMVSDEARAKFHASKRDTAFRDRCGLSFYTPNINIFRDPRWGRGMETLGEDPYLTATLGAAIVRGLQGDANAKYLKSIACAKHVAVHSGPESIRHQFDVSVSQRDLWTTYLPAFEYLINHGVRQVMCAYNRFQGEPCCANNYFLSDIVRNKWGYQYMVVSDCWAINDFWERDPKTPRHESHLTASIAMADAFNTEVDMECGNSQSALLEAAKDSLISEDMINSHLRRILTARFELGMFDPDSINPYSTIPLQVIDNEEHRLQSLKMAQKSIVLLKNEDNILPLSKNIRKIAVIGSNANDSTMLWGNYNGTPQYTTTILQGIKNRFPNAEIIYEIGCDLVLDTGNRENSKAVVDYDATCNRVKDAEVIIYVGGLSPKWEGEQLERDADGFLGGDRTKIELPKVQSKMLEKLSQLNKPLVFVLCTGSAVALESEINYVDALVNAWYGGEEAGNALADVLCGRVNPSGKLPVTFYKSTSQLPDFKNYDMRGRTYRYMNEKPLFPFGFGLSYSNFMIRIDTLIYNDFYSKKNYELDDSLAQVYVTVTNSGKYDGTEIVQIYLQHLDEENAPIKSLIAFQPVFLVAGESKTINIPLAIRHFEYFDRENPGNHSFVEMWADTNRENPLNYHIMVGNSSADEDLQTMKLSIKR